jgi:hypothetical protein
MYIQQRFAKYKLLFATHFQMSLNIYLLLVAIFFLQLELINEELIELSFGSRNVT